jgi:large subunit ribosomal protein L17
MKHHASQRKLGRETNQRRALLRGLVCALIKHERITTTQAKAKEIRPFVERLVTFGKRGTLSARRAIVSRLGGNDALVKKLINHIAPKYSDVKGGYTRVLKLPQRKGDASPMAIIEFV